MKMFTCVHCIFVKDTAIGDYCILHNEMCNNVITRCRNEVLSEGKLSEKVCETFFRKL